MPEATGPKSLPRPALDTREEYVERFMDAAYWRPYVAHLCARHGLTPCGEIRSGLPGTCPVFIVDGRAVVKFYGALFGGGAGFRLERAMYALLATDPAIPAPALLASGELFPGGDGWPWPYIVTRVIPGTSLTEAGGRVPYADRVAVARFLGPVVRRIHAMEPGPEGPLRPSWEAFVAFLEERRARCVESHKVWGSLPEHLVAQLDAYLPPVSDLVDQGVPPRVLHCDLNADHVLGAFQGGRWWPAGIIDFADAKVGDPMYELVALHIGLFRCDKHLLRTFLAEYGADGVLRHDFARRAMAMTLLHEFDVLGDVFDVFPEVRDVVTLPDLAALIWDLDGPGLIGKAGSG